MEVGRVISPGVGGGGGFRIHYSLFGAAICA